MNSKFSVILHGGAGAAPASAAEEDRTKAVLNAALDRAWSALCAGESGERAVVAALSVMEADELFDAGYGSYPNENGLVRCDVALMRGSGDFISYMNMRRIKHPSQVALDALDKRKTLMAVWTDEMMAAVDAGNTDLKQRYGWAATEAEMVAPEALQKVNARRQRQKLASNHDTVGCVVRDGQGRLFAGTSTGGIMLKPDGRVGDSPILGAGVYADDGLVGLSATGQGEVILKSLLSSFVVADIRSFLRADSRRFENEPDLLKKILRTELNEMQRKFPGTEAGLIVIPAHGNPSFDFTSAALPVAYRWGNTSAVEGESVAVARN